MASNFDFLQTRFPSLFEHASHAESLAYAAPRASCFSARFTLEQAVHWLYKDASEAHPIVTYNCLGKERLDESPRWNQGFRLSSGKLMLS